MNLSPRTERASKARTPTEETRGTEMKVGGKNASSTVDATKPGVEIESPRDVNFNTLALSFPRDYGNLQEFQVGVRRKSGKIAFLANRGKYHRTGGGERAKLANGRDKSNERPAIFKVYCEGVGIPKYLSLGTRYPYEENGYPSIASRMGNNREIKSKGFVLE